MCMCTYYEWDSMPNSKDEGRLRIMYRNWILHSIMLKSWFNPHEVEIALKTFIFEFMITICQ